MEYARCCQAVGCAKQVCVQVPRITRQAVLDRLTGQHLAMALHKSGASICTAQLLLLEEVRGAAVQAAIEQEEGVYQRGRAAKTVTPYCDSSNWIRVRVMLNWETLW
jgi:uncharacterized protein YbbC (DUF1343 family)